LSLLLFYHLFHFNFFSLQKKIEIIFSIYYFYRSMNTTKSTMSTFTATLAAPEPRNGLDGLNHFIQRTFANLGLVIVHFHTPTYQQLDAFRLVHIKFDFTLEVNDGSCAEHQKNFRLSDDTLAFRTRASYSTTVMARLNEFADAEAAFHAKDKETRGDFKTAVTVKPLEVVHTQASARSTEKFWKVKLVRPRAVAVIAMFR
jgi:hypothetical protein